MYVDSAAAAAAAMSRKGSIRERSFFVCVSGIVCCGVIIARPYGMAVDYCSDAARTRKDEMILL